jgi:GTP cyclohydrolase I
MALEIAFPVSREVPPEDQIIHGPITFVAHCERHGLPYFGKAYVGYVPTSERIGPAALRQMVKRAALRGEAALEKQIAAMLQVWVRPAGIASVVRTSHDCAGPRLLDEEGATRSTAWIGRYRADAALRDEFLARCQ